MLPAIELVRARRYVLGEASDDECAVIEHEYFGQSELLDALEAVEEALIEEYLDGRLDAHERERFERHYLAVPHHRIRVETIRRLKQITLPRVAARRTRTVQMLAIAATLVIVAGASLWMVLNRGASTDPSSTPPPGVSPATPPPPPRVIAMSISPVAVRGAADSPTLVIPAGTDVIDLRLEGDAGETALARGRVVVRTVNGDEIWQGPSASGPTLPAGVIARAEIPATRLRVDDYVVTLFDLAATGAETERQRYVLRVRAR